MSINGHKTSVQDVKERKEKYIKNSLHPSESTHTPPNKNTLCSSSSSPSSSVEASREGDGEGAKPPRRACRCDIRVGVYTLKSNLLACHK